MKADLVPANAIFFYGGLYSQWYPASMTVDGIRYNCAEQYMMAKKAMVFGDGKALLQIMSTTCPATQKAIGRKVQGFHPETWSAISMDVVVRGTLAKFGQNPDLRAILLRTHDRLIVEASPTDCIWGIGLSEVDEDRWDQMKWRGANLLGRAIMEVRSILQGR